MKIFLDTAHVPSIATWAATGLIDGVTTNPTHLSKESGDVKKQILDICALLPDGQISVQVTEKDAHAVYKQAHALAQLAPNIVVKIPCHADYYSTIKKLVDEGIKINITLVFTVVQALMMSKLGVEMISPFVGRLDDSDVKGVDILIEMREMLDEYGYETELLAASLRSVHHLHQAIMAGVDIATVPVAVLEQAMAHPLTDQGIKRFDDDWQKLGIKQFP